MNNTTEKVQELQDKINIEFDKVFDQLDQSEIIDINSFKTALNLLLFQIKFELTQFNDVMEDQNGYAELRMEYEKTRLLLRLQTASCNIVSQLSQRLKKN